MIHPHLAVEGRWPNCPLTLPISSRLVLQPPLPAVSPADSEKGCFILFLGTFPQHQILALDFDLSLMESTSSTHL